MIPYDIVRGLSKGRGKKANPDICKAIDPIAPIFSSNRFNNILCRVNGHNLKFYMVDSQPWCIFKIVNKAKKVFNCRSIQFRKEGDITSKKVDGGHRGRPLIIPLTRIDHNSTKTIHNNNKKYDNNGLPCLRTLIAPMFPLGQPLLIKEKLNEVTPTLYPFSPFTL